MRYKRLSVFVPIDDLELLCLNVIVSNMQKFYSEFRSGSSKIPSIYFEFLQRAYSEKLYRLLTKQCLFDEKYLDFLVNPYWKEVELNTGCSSALNLITKKLGSFGSVITSLNISHSLFSENELLAIVSSVPNITSLMLSGTDCSDEVLRCIRIMCPLLSNLDVSHCDYVTNKGLENLCLQMEGVVTNNTKLQSLNVRDTRVSKKGVSHILTHFPMMKCLRYEHLCNTLYKMHKQDLLNNTLDKARRYSLIHFEFEYYDYIDLQQALEIWSELCPNVKIIKISGLRTNYELQLCSKFQNLRKISITPSSPNPFFGFMPTFFMLRSETLSVIHLYAMPVSVKVLAQYCHNLQNITLNAVIFEDFDESDIKPVTHYFSCLQEVVIYHGYISELSTMKSICWLVTLSKKLDKLCLCYMRSFLGSVDTILQCSQSLTKFEVHFSDIEIPVVRKLFSNNNLNEITIYSCPNISDDDYARLEGAFGINQLTNSRFTWRRDISYEVKGNDLDDMVTNTLIF